MLAFKALLPKDDVVDLHLGGIEGTPEQVLIIKRFDRNLIHLEENFGGGSGDGAGFGDGSGNSPQQSPFGIKCVHFEEFNQLLGSSSDKKYQGAHKDMAELMTKTYGCLLVEIYRLYQRILAGILLGNTDMHLKNFAMFHTDSGLRLTPSYDQVAAALYTYPTMALAIGGARELPIRDLKPRSLVKMGEEFKLSKEVINMVCDELAANLDAAKEAVYTADIDCNALKDKLINFMEKRVLLLHQP